ncbi:MAG: DUF3299 domain-containing protein [Bryobacteraceae bacterium]|nr:DUF3299 domain-containing protein [Solibacteraceae bacterium]MCO5350587.1 DUF3299 domain-containing protein [Bryobacteraceae bacterium]
MGQLSEGTSHFRWRRSYFALLLLLLFGMGKMWQVWNSQIPEEGGAGTSTAPVITWNDLRELNVETGAASPRLQSANGRRVRVAGYMVPLDDDAFEVTQFLLVPWAGACIHTPPPPPNQMIWVKTRAGVRVPAALFQVFWIEGVLMISNAESPYGMAGYEFVAERVTRQRAE